MAIISGTILTQILGTVFVILAGVYIYFRYFLYNYWKKNGVSYLEPTIPVGNLGSVFTKKTSTGELFAEAYAKEKKNRYFGMYMLHMPSLVIADLDLVKYVLTKGFNHFYDRGMYCNEQVDPLSGHLFLLSGTKWRNLRAKLSPTFTSGKIKQMFGIVVDSGDELTEYLKLKAVNREVIEMKDLFARFNTNVIMSAAFGINCDCLKDPNNEFRHWGRKIFDPKPVWNCLGAFAPQIMDFFSIPLTDVDVGHFFMNAFKNTVEFRVSNNVTRPDFMNLLMQLMKRGYVDSDDNKEEPTIREGIGKKLTMSEAAAQAFGFFMAGFETSSSVITFCLYELACNQEIQEKVMKDIDTVLKKFGALTYESLQEMTYLHKVLSETMRKYPSSPILNRVCTDDLELPTTNFHVKKGTDIVIPVLGIHRDPEIYPEPNKFDPERFSQENIAARHPYAYLPFGEGPRICIGMRFGLAQTKVALVSVFSKFRVRLGPDTPVPLEMDPGGFLLTAKSGIELFVEPR